MGVLPPVHRYLPLVLQQAFGHQELVRMPEPDTVTSQHENVVQYDQVMSTRLAIAYAIGIEIVYRVRLQPFGGKSIDLACGPGHFSLCLSKYLKLDSLIGIDLSEPMIEVAQANAAVQNRSNIEFALGDVTSLAEYADAQFDLSTFTDAAHHLPDIQTVQNTVREMDRVTRPDGLVVVMDLVRLRNVGITNSYVELVGRDYIDRGLDHFYDDFRNSMFAAWTVDEFAEFVPTTVVRQWCHFVPRGLPTVQFLIGMPWSQRRLFCRRGLPARDYGDLVAPPLRSEWRLARGTINLGTVKYVRCRSH